MSNNLIESILQKTATDSISQAISDAKTFAIFTHRRPDGDAISSSLAVFWYLLDIGKKESDIDVLIPEFIFEDFAFIPGIEKIKKSPTKEKYDVIIIVDCAIMHFLKGREYLNCGKETICIDHHDGSSIPTTYRMVDTSVASCTCILYRLFPCKNKEFLTCIAAGLISDTSVLSLNVNEKEKNIIQELKESGIDTNNIISELTSQSDRTLALVEITKKRGYFVNSPNGKIFCTYILQSDLLDDEKSLATVNHKAIILELQKDIKFDFLILAIEKKNGEFKGSIRTFNTQVDLTQICYKLLEKGKLTRGGGHSFSSGFSAVGTYSEILTNISKEIENY